jgi:DNA-binding transcriptional LysR family regulator
MELGQLRAFETVARELHFGRAALQLGLSQPQVSRQVRALEEELGVELFVRTPRRTELTGAGASLLDDAQDALAAVQRLRVRAGIARRAFGGRVSVAFLWSTLGACLAPLVAAAAERLPDVELAVAQVAFLEILPGLRRGDADLAVVRPLREPHELIERVLRREPSVIAVWETHPLADQDAVALEQLQSEPMVALQRALVPAPYDAALASARARGLEPNIVQHARSPSEALALVSAGIGLYKLPSSAATPFPGVTYREVSDTPSALVLVHRPAPAPAVQAVVDLALDIFSDTAGASNDTAPDLETAALAP